MKFIFLCTFLSLLLCSTIAIKTENSLEEKATERTNLYHCPCKCYFGHEKKYAKRECRKYPFNRYCEVRLCYSYRQVVKEEGAVDTTERSHGHSKGLECCDLPPSPSPSASPSKKPQNPECPCHCTSYRKASKQCHHYPGCSVSKCSGHGHGHRKSRHSWKYECCNSHY